jgi:hypothetical protein
MSRKTSLPLLAFLSMSSVFILKVIYFFVLSDDVSSVVHANSVMMGVAYGMILVLSVFTMFRIIRKNMLSRKTSIWFIIFIIYLLHFLLFGNIDFIMKHGRDTLYMPPSSVIWMIIYFGLLIFVGFRIFFRTLGRLFSLLIDD